MKICVVAGLQSFKKIRIDSMASGGSVELGCGYGLVIVSSSSIGKTSVSVKDASSITSIKEVTNILVESLTEHSFRVTNRASIPVSMTIIVVGFLS